MSLHYTYFPNIPSCTNNSSGTSLPIGREFPWLAPLAGFSDLPFRLLCREVGAAVTCTEMISAKGLVFAAERGGGAGTFDLLSTVPADSPLVVQLFGAEPDYLYKAVKLLQDKGFTWFDLNMGCSVPKVTKTGAGAALLRDPKAAKAAVQAFCKAAGPSRAGIKMRLGWEKDKPVYLDLAKAFEDAGAAWLTLHPRYAMQKFSGKSDSDALARLVGAVSLPVMGSGDLFTAEDALKCLETGVEGIMFARGAMNNPLIFRDYLDLLQEPQLTMQQKNISTEEAVKSQMQNLYTLIKKHAELAKVYATGAVGRRGFSPGLLKMRTVVPRYVRDMPGAKHLRQELINCESWERLDNILEDFFALGTFNHQERK